MIKNLQILADATHKAILDPTDTKQAFRVAEALSFRGAERMTRRFKKSRSGSHRLSARIPLIESLVKREVIEAMPADSLGAHYIRFIDAEGITPDGLVAASHEGRVRHADPEVEFVASEIRDMHDLWHVITGYQTDLLGEAALLAFSSAQLRHPGVGFLAAVGIALSDTPYYRRFILDGFRRGHKAAWLPAQNWEKLLPRPLAEVREMLGIEAVGPYAEVRDEPIERIALAA